MIPRRNLLQDVARLAVLAADVAGAVGVGVGVVVVGAEVTAVVDAAADAKG